MTAPRPQPSGVPDAPNEYQMRKIIEDLVLAAECAAFEYSSKRDALEERLDAALTALYARLERAERDTARLDWLTKTIDEGDDIAIGANADGTTMLHIGMVTEMQRQTFATADAASLRSAIDTASENTR